MSKFLSLVLRHRPDDYGLHMDKHGWVDFADLIDVLAAEDIVGEDAEQIVQDLVQGSDRQRFEIAGGKIRALYGHSDRVHLELPEDEPPEVLFHGTTLEAARKVAQDGLQPMGRAYVHLSSTEQEALAVGRRHEDHPVLIRVDTFAAIERGLKFHRATEQIWLSPAVPAEVCRVPDLPEESAPRPAAAPPRPATPPAPRPAPGPRAEGVRVVAPDPDEGFKRRTRKKNRR
ncbi:MAG: RNA 2'-phosphotransferase [Candidatus Eiseniibacteriota bacterium]